MIRFETIYPYIKENEFHIDLIKHNNFSELDILSLIHLKTLREKNTVYLNYIENKNETLRTCWKVFCLKKLNNLCLFILNNKINNRILNSNITLSNFLINFK